MKKWLLLTIIIGGILVIGGIIFSNIKNKNLTEENARLIVQNFLIDYNDMDFEGMYTHTHDEHRYFDGMYIPDSESNVYMFQTLSNNMKYEIKDVSIIKGAEGKEAIVNAHITNMNVKSVLNTITNEFIAFCEQENIENYDVDSVFLDITKRNFDNAENPLQEKDTVFNLVEQNGNWKIESNIMIYDDVTGGYMSYYYENVVFDGLVQK